MASFYTHRPISLAGLVTAALVRFAMAILGLGGWLIAPVVRLARDAWVFVVRATAPPGYLDDGGTEIIDLGGVRSRAYEERRLARLARPDLSIGRGLCLAA